MIAANGMELLIWDCAEIGVSVSSGIDFGMDDACRDDKSFKIAMNLISLVKVKENVTPSQKKFQLL